ncbi:LacI family DNA-binding transcriptional regulator [Microbacterium soli]|uniref:LacI family DNA-binding transcriptional regulator n=2 Tax=Microbacterium soli TaxID=446075 RepID=A0ABP7N015_9MICO
MVDVAKRAGVAHVTVSRVLNDPDSVRPATRERVEQAIAELGYQRNDMARALKRGRSGMLGVIIAGAELFELPRVLLGVEEAAHAAGYWVSMASWQSGGLEQLNATIDRLVGQAAEGIAVIADRSVAARALERVGARIPLSVVMSGDVPNPAIGSVELDQELGARLATRHLLELGHAQVVHISGRLGTFDAQARVRGWTAEMQASGTALPRMLEGDFTARSGYRAGMALASEPQPPTAVFAGNDQMVIGLLAAFAEQELRVPQDVSVVGFDDMAGADYFVPALTTVRQDFRQLGRRSIEVLLELIGGAEARHHLIAPSLVVRRSTAAPLR